MNEIIRKIPKAELHVHLEGTLEPELMYRFAERNQISLPHNFRKSNYQNLKEFLSAYYHAQSVIKTEQDFYELLMAYGKRAHEQGVVHAEIFFETQSYYDKNISLDVMMAGLLAAITDIKREYKITIYLILCLLRDLLEKAAYSALQAILPFQEYVIGIGLASQEMGNPPSKFVTVFKYAKELGLHRVAHAGEEVNGEYIQQALQLLEVERIDHGIKIISDSSLIVHVVAQKIPFTVCPLSNVVLAIVPSINQHPIKKMLSAGISVSIHSDDPAFFGGYIADNYQAVYDAQLLTLEELFICARNSIIGSFLPQKEKELFLYRIDTFYKAI